MRADFSQMESWVVDPRVERDLRELNRQQAARGGEFRPQALWLACRDKVVDRVVERISTVEGTFVLRRSCDDGLGGGNFQRWPVAVIRHAIEVLQVPEIVICGHSGCETTSDGRTPIGVPFPQRSAPILRRVERRLRQIRSAQDFVVQQLASLHQMPAIREALAGGRLTLHGVFYLADSGSYLRYDAVAGRFLPVEGGLPTVG